MYVAYAEYKQKPLLITSNSSETIYHLFVSDSIPNLQIFKIVETTKTVIDNITQKHDIKVLDLFPIKMSLL